MWFCGDFGFSWLVHTHECGFGSDFAARRSGEAGFRCVIDGFRGMLPGRPGAGASGGGGVKEALVRLGRRTMSVAGVLVYGEKCRTR